MVVRKDQEWSLKVWVPLAAAAGLKRVALVTSESGLGKGERVTAEPGYIARHLSSLAGSRSATMLVSPTALPLGSEVRRQRRV